DLVDPDALTRLARQRPVHDRMAEPELGGPGRLRLGELGLPQVLGDAVAPGVPGADPDQPAVVVDLIGLAVSAVGLHRRGQVAAGLVELPAPDVAVTILLEP